MEALRCSEKSSGRKGEGWAAARKMSVQRHQGAGQGWLVAMYARGRWALPVRRRRAAGGADFLMRASNAVKAFIIFCISRYDSEQKKYRTLAKMCPSESVGYTLINIPSW